MIRRAAPGFNNCRSRQVLHLPLLLPPRHRTTHTKLDVHRSKTLHYGCHWPSRYCLLTLFNKTAPNSTKFTLLARPRDNHGSKRRPNICHDECLVANKSTVSSSTVIRDSNLWGLTISRYSLEERNMFACLPQTVVGSSNAKALRSGPQRGQQDFPMQTHAKHVEDGLR